MNTLFRSERLDGGAGVRIEAHDAGGRLSYRAWLSALANQPDTSLAFARCLAQVPFVAFAWECRAVTSSSLDHPLEMVAVDSPALASVSAEPAPFRSELAKSQGDVATFDNLGGDARLVVPHAVSNSDCYAHLASFVRGAPPAQISGLWRAVALAVEARLQERGGPLWLSTAGLGVSWLHVRLDDRPKYYRHAPFKRA